MSRVFRFLIERLGEVSTYKGAVFALTGLGCYIRPEIAAAITSIGLGVGGLLGVLTADPVPPAE